MVFRKHMAAHHLPEKSKVVKIALVLSSYLVWRLLVEISDFPTAGSNQSQELLDFLSVFQFSAIKNV